MAPATAADALQKSSTVFRGRVVAIYRSFFDRVGITNTAGYRVQFEITKQWKGARSKSTVVITRLTGEACGFPFEENKEYLVYVVTEPRRGRYAGIKFEVLAGDHAKGDQIAGYDLSNRLNH